MTANITRPSISCTKMALGSRLGESPLSVMYFFALSLFLAIAACIPIVSIKDRTVGPLLGAPRRDCDVKWLQVKWLQVLLGRFVRKEELFEVCSQELKRKYYLNEVTVV